MVGVPYPVPWWVYAFRCIYYPTTPWVYPPHLTVSISTAVHAVTVSGAADEALGSNRRLITGRRRREGLFGQKV